MLDSAMSISSKRPPHNARAYHLITTRSPFVRILLEFTTASYPLAVGPESKRCTSMALCCQSSRGWPPKPRAVRHAALLEHWIRTAAYIPYGARSVLVSARARHSAITSRHTRPQTENGCDSLVEHRAFLVYDLPQPFRHGAHQLLGAHVLGDCLRAQNYAMYPDHVLTARKH